MSAFFLIAKSVPVWLFNLIERGSKNGKGSLLPSIRFFTGNGVRAKIGHFWHAFQPNCIRMVPHLFQIVHTGDGFSNDPPMRDKSSYLALARLAISA